MLGWLRRRPEEPREREPELFDESFQRRLEALALLSRRAVIGTRRGERRSKKTGGGIEFATDRQQCVANLLGIQAARVEAPQEAV